MVNFGLPLSPGSGGDPAVDGVAGGREFDAGFLGGLRIVRGTALTLFSRLIVGDERDAWPFAFSCSFGICLVRTRSVCWNLSFP